MTWNALFSCVWQKNWQAGFPWQRAVSKAGMTSLWTRKIVPLVRVYSQPEKIDEVMPAIAHIWFLYNANGLVCYGRYTWNTAEWNSHQGKLERKIVCRTHEIVNLSRKKCSLVQTRLCFTTEKECENSRRKLCLKGMLKGDERSCTRASFPTRVSRSSRVLAAKQISVMMKYLIRMFTYLLKLCHPC